MSKSIVTLQVPPQVAIPRGACVLGSAAAVLFVTLRNVVRAVSAAADTKQARRHA